MINLITSFYLPININRKNELIKTLINNIKNEHISNIYLYLDNNECHDYIKDNIVDEHNKIIIIEIGKQPLYSDLFDFANTLENKICMIANSDIWIHDVKNIKLLEFINNKENIIYSLTRHEYDFSCPLIDNYSGSHDAFIFKSPINKELIKHIKHPQNVWGSENVLLYELYKLNYIIFNPCKSIILIHEHSSNIRNTGKRINKGGIDSDGNYKVRSRGINPSEPKL